MTRRTVPVLCGLAAVLLVVPGRADDPPKKLTPEQRKELRGEWARLRDDGFEAFFAGDYAKSQSLFEKAVGTARRLYPKDDYPDGHADVVTSLYGVGSSLRMRGKPADAVPPLRDALEMARRLNGGDDPAVATSLTNLAAAYQDLGKPADAEVLFREALGMFKRLLKGDHHAVAQALNNLAAACKDQGKYADAEPLFAEALAMVERLFKGDHKLVITALNNLGAVSHDQGRYGDAERLYRRALEMSGRLAKGGDSTDVALCLGNLAVLSSDRGRPADSERFAREALAMRRRLHTADHAALALALSNLATTLKAQGKLAESEQFQREALDMFTRVFKGGDHAHLAISLKNLGSLEHERGKLEDAERWYVKALEMRRRLFKGDHPDIALSLNNLAVLYHEQGKDADAERLHTQALEMRQRVYRGDHHAVANSLRNMGVMYHDLGRLADAERVDLAALAMLRRVFAADHPDVALALNNLGALRQARGRHAEAVGLYKEALAMRRRLLAGYAARKSEGEALNLVATLPLTRDAFLSAARRAGAEPAEVYAELWAEKGMIGRVYEQRQLAGRSAADPAAARLFAELSDVRRRRAELLLAPPTSDPGTRKKREDDLRKLDDEARRLNDAVGLRLPAVARADRLNAATAAELQKALPADAAIVDYLGYTDFDYNPALPGKKGKRKARQYLAFVVTRGTVARVELGDAAAVESAVAVWRDAVVSGKDVPAADAARVRELVWQKVRAALPAGTRVVYVCPDASLCRVPWPAVPGDRPGTVVLEDFAVATIPHAPFLLDKLWPRDPARNPPAGALVVGGVRYDAVVARGAAAADPPLKPGARPGWSFLANTVGEANGFASAAGREKLATVRLDGVRATAAAVLAALPEARYAHLATHGFFADPSFRGVFQLDEKEYEQSQDGERIGRAANSPLVMTGLVFAGANNPGTPGRGILTGEQLVDLDLSGLELAVLSACETGVGDVAGGEGTFGLQRAFHHAGARDVVASLWKVPDQPTAALMNVFYENLWHKAHSPVEALRQAQLEIYRNPGKIAGLAKGFRGQFEEVAGKGGEVEVEVRPGPAGTAHPLLWAAFTLSGPGR